MTPIFVRLVQGQTQTYAEMFFRRGNLGAAHAMWWDLDQCRFEANNYRNLGLDPSEIEKAITELEKKRGGD